MNVRVNVKARLIRHGKVIKTARFHNDVTDEGKNLLLDIMFHDIPKEANWYIGLIDEDAFTILSPLDTMASHFGWGEWEDYDETDRQPWITTDASFDEIWTLATTPAIFTMNQAGTLKGIFVASDDAKGGTTGYLWATALFADSNLGMDWDVDNADIVQLAYGVVIS